MPLDPWTPVIVGVGQVTDRPGHDARFGDRPTPLSLLVEAAHRALSDSGSTALRHAVSEVTAIRSFTWHPDNPARLLADALGLANVTVAHTSGVGGNVPQLSLHRYAARIAQGDPGVFVVAGSEAMHAASLARREGVRPDWRDEKGDNSTLMGDEDVPLTAAEYVAGLTQPTDCYPHFENSRRLAAHWNHDEHIQLLGALWARCAQVARNNPYAWITTGPSAHDITTATESNRLVASPYTKFMVANLPVDMGAAYIVTSYQRARELGVSAERLAFVHAGADAADHWFMSDRPVLHDSPAMRALWGALRATGLSVDDLDAFDIYSCFPTVVLTAAEVLGIDPLRDERAPTVTGGLTFGGGPGNNYTTHGICQMVERVRGSSQRGLTTGLGWFSTKHSWGIIGGAPAPGGFRYADLHAEVAAQPRAITTERSGQVRVESFTVVADRNGEPQRATIAGRHLSGERSWARCDDPDIAGELMNRDSPEIYAAISAGQFTLRDN